MAATAGWYPDPTGEHALRYWDGAAWTDHVAHGTTEAAEVSPRSAPGQPMANEQSRAEAESGSVDRATGPLRMTVLGKVAVVVALILFAAMVVWATMRPIPGLIPGVW